ncbi:hypothetical protein CHISP_1610 [Chitinispirillum alkaliphilum]|nr:hypothetical protein CHISP_1610 [Chitinispirillum alkaliphilum]
MDSIPVLALPIPNGYPGFTICTNRTEKIASRRSSSLIFVIRT